jgi:hypothetical protein
MENACLFYFYFSCENSSPDLFSREEQGLQAFFLLTRNTFHQDRERPNHLGYVFTSGAIAGGFCALLQTPVSW